ncbi:MAG: DUF1501 domain-containing protein [Byssovorax sp.]
MSLSRRRFLEIAGLAGGGVALRSILSPRLAQASPDNPQLLLACYLGGGSDQLLSFDPRDASLAKFQAPAAYASGGTGIHPAYDLVVDARVKAVLAATGGSGIQKKGALTFGPAMPASLMSHSADLAVLRGVYMGTLTHEVGRRYFTTGKFPRGLSAAGSSLGTAVAAADGKTALIPNLAISAETYNETFPSYASGIGVNSFDDVLSLLKPLGTALSAGSDMSLAAYEAAIDDCTQRELNGGGLVDTFKESRLKARTMISASASALFNFKVPAPPGLDDLFTTLGIKTTTDFKGPKGNAAIAAQALTNGISEAVSLQLAGDLDDHNDWGDTHATGVADALDAIGNLITFLKKTPYKGGATMTWEHTTLLIFSEFARTPLLNGRAGRDHHLASSCVVAGPGIKGNQIFGATSDSAMVVRNVNPTTGKPDDANGIQLRPADIHATLLHSMGLSYDHLSNQSPQMLSALLLKP